MVGGSRRGKQEIVARIVEAGEGGVGARGDSGRGGDGKSGTRG